MDCSDYVFNNKSKDVKKVIRISVIVIFTVLLLILVLGIINKTKDYDKLATSIKRLPDFSFLTIDKDTLNSSDILKGPLLIMHFNPECEHCKYETKSILESKLPLMHYRVLMVTEAPSDSVKKFYDAFELYKYPSISVLLDSAYMFSEKFASRIIPSNYIYNRNLELVKILKGEYKPETIIKYLTECD